MLLWHTIKALSKTKCCFDMKTTRPSRSANLIKPQTLRGLINVPAKFHKWGINYNWFHSLIHLLKWHSSIHMLTCFAISLGLQSLREWVCYLILYSKYHFEIFRYTELIATPPRWIQYIPSNNSFSHTGQLMRRLYNLVTTWYVLLSVQQAVKKCNFP